MKTKDLNFIEAYEAFKAGHEVYFNNSMDHPVKVSKHDFTGMVDAEFVLTTEKYFIKPKPLTAEFECEWEKIKYDFAVPFGESGCGIGDKIRPFIGKKTRVTIKEVVE